MNKNEYFHLFKEYKTNIASAKWIRCWAVPAENSTTTMTRYIVEYKDNPNKFYVQMNYDDDGAAGTFLIREKCTIFDDLEQAMFAYIMVGNNV